MVRCGTPEQFFSAKEVTLNQQQQRQLSTVPSVSRPASDDIMRIYAMGLVLIVLLIIGVCIIDYLKKNGRHG